jgi:hypothetical protein
MGRYLCLLLAAAAATMACGDKVCLTAPNPVVQADIRDSVTNAPSAYRASLILEGNGIYDSTYVGAPADSLTAVVQSAPPGQAGTYTVRVRRDGYRVWERRGVYLGSGCTVAPSVTLSVRLQRLP